jgi:hypothetical protein
VLTSKEISSVFEPRPMESKAPLANPDLLAAELLELGTLEHVLALEYLYARYSIHSYLRQDPTFRPVKEFCNATGKFGIADLLKQAMKA